MRFRHFKFKFINCSFSPSDGFGHFISNSDLFHLQDRLDVKFSEISIHHFTTIISIPSSHQRIRIHLHHRLIRQTVPYAVVSFTGMSKISRFMCYCRTSFFFVFVCLVQSWKILIRVNVNVKYIECKVVIRPMYCFCII